MKDKELRKLIGSRAKQRRLELNLTQPYVAEKMGVTASTILRYENGSIDNTKKMVLEGLSEALHVSIEWLRGETDEYETDITDKKELQIRDAMGDILKMCIRDSISPFIIRSLSNYATCWISLRINIILITR